jgi:single-stranded-DNA-specific exonuclease
MAYARRGVCDAHQMDLGLGGLFGVSGLAGVDAAVELLEQALQDGQRILIVGDYDADGASATALGLRVLRAFGARNLGYMIPDRFAHGYGLCPEIAELAAAQGGQLIVTVDNGISSEAGVRRARELGMRVLVTDHHLPGDKLPPADAIVNPNQPDDTFPSKHLAGVGVIFYLLSALRARLRRLGWFAESGRKEPVMADFLDLVALGTVADLVRLDRNNRILVEQGLRRIRAGRCCPGVTALLMVAGRSVQRTVASDLGFAVGPRLNAAGRLEDMGIGVECLLTDDPDQALEFARTLDALNQQRRHIEGEMQRQADVLMKRLSPAREGLPFGLCLFDPDWHQGVIGILASRLKESYQRPAIALALADGDTLKGSGRSITGLHIRDALAAVDARHPGLLQRFGGHAMAAGLSIARDRWQQFARAFDSEVRERLAGQVPEAEVLSDGPLAPQELNAATARALRYAGPWGQGFPEPVFDGEFEVIAQRWVGDAHLRLELAAEDGTKVDAIAFRWRDRPPAARRVRVAYRLDLNAFQGKESPQLLIDHLLNL